jgi:hypothetical protein
MIFRETSLALAHELFPAIEREAVADLFTGTKQWYLRRCDQDALAALNEVAAFVLAEYPVHIVIKIIIYIIN